VYLGISKWFYLFSLLIAILFISVPQIDVMITSLFFTKAKGFFWSDSFIIRVLFNIPKPIVGLAILSLLVLIIDLVFRKRLFGIRPLFLFYFVSVMVIGPGLIVNTVFKDNWGRARPLQTTEFNGAAIFTPAFIPSDQCKVNCSFVCGHAAGTYALITLALLVKRRRTIAMTGAIVLGSFVGLGRMIQGAHFFSDVIFSFVIVYLSSKVLYYFIFEKQLFNLIDERCTPLIRTQSVSS